MKFFVESIMFKRSIAIALSASCLSFLLFSPTIKSIAAENPIKTTCAIDWIPKATTAFGIMLKNKEQLDLILNSKAYKKLTELGGTKMLIEKFNEGYTGNLKEGDKDQFNQILAAMGELFSHEVVIATGPNAPKSLGAILSAVSASQMAPLTLLMQGNFDQDAISKAQGESIIQALVESSKDLKVPELLLAFKLKNKKTGEDLIKKLEDKLPMIGTAEPKFKGAAKKEKIAGADFLTLKLKGSMFPIEGIDQIPGVEEGQLKNSRPILQSSLLLQQLALKMTILL